MNTCMPFMGMKCPMLAEQNSKLTSRLQVNLG